MPIMPRVKGKAKKIAFNILGIPANMRDKIKTDKKIKRRLTFEATARVR